jgi:hypothetical protein
MSSTRQRPPIARKPSSFCAAFTPWIPQVCLFREMRRLQRFAADDATLLIGLLAMAREPILRECLDMVLKTPVGESLGRAAIRGWIRAHAPGKYSERCMSASATTSTPPSTSSAISANRWARHAAEPGPSRYRLRHLRRLPRLAARHERYCSCKAAIRRRSISAPMSTLPCSRRRAAKVAQGRPIPAACSTWPFPVS